MLVVVNQHHTDNFKIEGNISSSTLDMLKSYYGSSLHVENSSDDDEWVNIKDTDWYKEMKKTYSPASNLAFYRKEKKLTPAELGDRLGVPKQYISDMEHERRSISKEMAKKDCVGFRFSGNTVYMKERIKQIRLYFSLSQTQFAKMLNKSAGFISTIETGRCGVSEDTVNNICSIFGIDKGWLLKGEGTMFPPGSEKSVANKEEAGDRVRKVRKDNNLTQEQFAKKIGYSMILVHMVESGKATASNDFLSQISSVFGISYNWLLTGEGEEKSDEAVVDEELIEWLRRNPDEVRRLRIKSGLV